MPDDRMLSEEEIDTEYANSLDEQVFARRIEVLVRDRMAERLEAFSKHPMNHRCEDNIMEAARLVRGAK